MKKTIYWSTHLRLYHKQYALATYGLTICQQDRVSNHTLTRLDINSLLLDPWVASLVTQTLVVETCVILYGAENWILDEGCLELLELLWEESSNTLPTSLLPCCDKIRPDTHACLGSYLLASSSNHHVEYMLYMP